MTWIKTILHRYFTVEAAYGVNTGSVASLGHILPGTRVAAPARLQGKRKDKYSSLTRKRKSEPAKAIESNDTQEERKRILLERLNNDDPVPPESLQKPTSFMDEITKKNSQYFT